MLKCTTYSQNLDNLLAGGIETQAVTEFMVNSAREKLRFVIRLVLLRKLRQISTDWVVQRFTLIQSQHSDRKESPR